MNARLRSRMLVDAIRRRVEAAGGSATVVAHGDDVSGSLLLVLARHGRVWRILERGLGPDGDYRWIQAGPGEDEKAAAFDDYVARRRRSDPDLWAIEIDSPDTMDWVEEMTGIGD